MAFLSPEQMAKATEAIAAQPADEAPDTVDTATETADVDPATSAQATSEQAKKPATQPPEGGEQPPAQPETAKPQDEVAIQKLVEDRGMALASEYLERLAKQSPELYKAIYEKDPPAGMFQPKPAEAPTDPNKTVDPIQKELAELKKFRDEQVHREQQREISERREVFLDQVEELMQPHRAVYEHPIYGEQAQYTLGSMIRSNPKVPVPQLVKQVAEKFQGMERAIKDGYVSGKKEAARKVPAGAGGTSAPPPPSVPGKLKLGRGPGSTQEALANFLGSQGG